MWVPIVTGTARSLTLRRLVDNYPRLAEWTASAVTYPHPPDAVTRDEAARVLSLVGFGDLADRLEEDAPWDRILSGGEKQRLAFARVFCIDPISSCSTRRHQRLSRKSG